MNRHISARLRIPSLVTGLLLFALTPTQGATAKDSDFYYEVLAQKQAVGYVHCHLHPTAGHLKATSDTVIHLSLAGSPLNVTAQEIFDYAGDIQKPLAAAETLTSAGNSTTMRAIFHARNIDFTQVAGGSSVHTRVPIPIGTWLIGGMEFWEAALRQTAPNAKSFTLTGFNLLTGHTQSVVFTRDTAARESTGERWQTSLMTSVGPTPLSLVYRRTDGRIVELTNVAQHLSIRLADKQALKGYGALDLTSRAFAVVDQPLGDADSLKLLRLQVAATLGVGKASPVVLQRPPYQSFQGTAKDNTVSGVFTLHPYVYTGAHAAKFPYTQASIAAQSAFLKPEGMAQSDDPQIRSLGRSLTAGTKTGWEAAAKIGWWVTKNIAYELTGSSASQCLRSRKGDCGPHTYLTIALCRAAGIPARITGGALYTPLLGGSYGQHYWTEVWMGPKDGWVPIDTTAGEIGTLSPTHLTLWHLANLQSLSVKVLDYAPHAVAKAPDAPALRHPNGLAVGYHERYGFQLGGVSVGSQTADLKEITAGGQHWSYALRLLSPQDKKTVALEETGEFVISDSDEPKTLALNLQSGGMTQTANFSFAPTQITAVVTLGKVATPRTIPRTDPVYPNLANVMTMLSLATRSTDLSTGKPLVLPLFSAESLTTTKLTLTPLRAETVPLIAKPTPCHIYKMDPGGFNVWLADATGEIVQLRSADAKLVVARE